LVGIRCLGVGILGIMPRDFVSMLV
jgi:hypothetical protein